MRETRTIAVLGAGNGGQTMAADLAAQGYRIHLWNRSRERLQPIQDRKGIQLEGLLTGFGRPALITSDLQAAVRNADILMVVVTANAHRSLARKLVPHLQDGQILILVPGRTGGALEVRQVFREEGFRSRVYVAEAQSLPYACRLIGPATVLVSGIKNILPLAALPATDTPHVLKAARGLFPGLTAAQHVLETSLGNIGVIFHPAVALLNASRIEQAEPFLFYKSITPSISSFLEMLDQERREVGEAFGVRLVSASRWLTQAYEEIQGHTLYERLSSNAAYENIWGPTTLKTRLLCEEIPTGLVPLAALGRIADVSTPLCSSLSIIASTLTGIKTQEGGRTLARMGIAGMSADALSAFVLYGTRRRLISSAGIGSPAMNHFPHKDTRLTSEKEPVIKSGRDLSLSERSQDTGTIQSEIVSA